MRHRILKVLVFLTLSDGAAVAAEPQRLRLQGDYLGMVEVRDASGAAQLAVVGADDRAPRRRRFVELFDKRGGTLTKSPTKPLPDDAAAYDVCGLSAVDPPAGALVSPEPAAFLVVRPDGVYRLGEETPLVREETLFPGGRDDALPRVRLCFHLFKGEPPALLVPDLRGVVIHRQRKPGVFERHARLGVDAEVGFQGQLLRGPEAQQTQRVAVRLQFPDVTTPDFDGDGLVDLCFNLEEHLVCKLQDRAGGFAAARTVEHWFPALSRAETSDTSLKVTSRVVDLSGDGRPDVVIGKATWNVSDMGGTLKIYVQGANGVFPETPTQELARDGYFAYQEYLDFDGDGRLDLVAPVADLGWGDLAKIYLSRRATIDFVWYRNVGGRFETRARPIHSIAFPVDFKNMTAILGALPLWDVRLTEAAPKSGTRHVLFLPGRTALELRATSADGVAGKPLWRLEAELGSDTLATDLDGDGRHELVSAYPKDPRRAGSLLFVEASGEARSPQ